MLLIIPPQMECSVACIENMDECLPFTTERAQVRIFLLPQMQIGIMRDDALSANLKGTATMASAKTLAETGVAVRLSSPCRGRWRRCSCLAASSSSVHILFTATLRVFLLREGSSLIASLTITAGLNLFLCAELSSRRLSSAIRLTMGSGEVSSWQCLEV